MFKYDFLQAKLHGIHSKSIVGDNYNKLKRYKSSSYVYNGINFTQFLNEINDMDSESEIIRIM